MNRRAFCRVGGTGAAGALVLPSFLAHAATLFAPGAALTFRVQVSTSAGFEAGSLFADLAGLAVPQAEVAGLAPRTTYHWRVNATDGTATSPWSETSTFATGAAVAADDAPAARFALGVPYPNPARATARFPFTLAEAGPVVLELLDLRGREVARVLDDVRPAGPHDVAWDTAGLAAGAYVVRLRTPTARATGRLTVVR